MIAGNTRPKPAETRTASVPTMSRARYGFVNRNISTSWLNCAFEVGSSWSGRADGDCPAAVDRRKGRMGRMVGTQSAA